MRSRLLALLPPLAVVVGFYALTSRVAKRLLGRRHAVGAAVIDRFTDNTSRSDRTGAVTSVQSGEVVLPVAELERLWSPASLERLARTYWRFLSRATLGIVHVEYTERERYVVAFRRPFALLTFQAPEYAMDDKRGVVRWRIEKGVLVARRGRGGDGYLEIDVERLPCDQPGMARMRVEVEVANFYPSIASRFGQWFYAATQSRIHVLVTYGFLRGLAKLDLAESKVGRFAHPSDVPDPVRESPSARLRAPA